jgi:hypothetical protein
MPNSLPEDPIMSHKGVSKTVSNLKSVCHRMQASWSKSERERRHTVACHRQQALWDLLSKSRPSAISEMEIVAVGAPTIADLARLAG